MLLLRQLPDPKRLEPLARNEAYRKSFYARWGVENAIIVAKSRRVEFPVFEQRLSIKACSGGRERYLMTRPGREVDVDDDNYLILNDGRSYASCISSEREVESYSIFFRPGFAAEVASAVRAPIGRALEGGSPPEIEPEFQEFLQPHDRRITPVLNYIRHHVRAGFDDAQWYEEQLYFLLVRMLEHREQEQRRMAAMTALRRATRSEVYRRIMHAVTYIHAHFDRNLSLDRLASEACLSKYHFLRLFSEVMGHTPYAYLLRKRASAAERLMATTSLTVDEIAQQVGFSTRSSLFRQMRRHGLRAVRQPPQARCLRRSR